MDFYLMDLQVKLDCYRKLSHTTNPFAFKQSDYDKYLYYKKKLTEYYKKAGYKVKTKEYKPSLRMSDWTEDFENTKI